MLLKLFATQYLIINSIVQKTYFTLLLIYKYKTYFRICKILGRRLDYFETFLAFMSRELEKVNFKEFTF